MDILEVSQDLVSCAVKVCGTGCSSFVVIDATLWPLAMWWLDKLEIGRELTFWLQMAHGKISTKAVFVSCESS